MNVLVLNGGSSSVRFQVIDTDPEAAACDADRRLVQGRVERVGGHALIVLEATAPDRRVAAMALGTDERQERPDGSVTLTLVRLSERIHPMSVRPRSAGSEADFLAARARPARP